MKQKRPKEGLTPNQPDKPIITADAVALERGLVQIPPLAIVQRLEQDSGDPIELKLNIKMAPDGGRDIRS